MKLEKKSLVLYWKRGVVLYIASQLLVYLIGMLFGIGQEIWTTLGRAMTVSGIISVLLSWIVAPIITGWLITEVVNRIKK